MHATAKIVVVSSSSRQSFEDAIQTAITKGIGTVKNVQGAWVNEPKVMIKDDKIIEYQVNLKISFSRLNTTIHIKKSPIGDFFTRK